MKYEIQRSKRSKKFTLFLGGGPGQNSFHYKDTIFKDLNVLIVHYTNTLDFRENNTGELIKSIVEIVKKEDINIKNIVGFSFGSFLSNYLIKELKPDRIINVGFLYKFEQLERAYLEERMGRFYQKLVNGIWNKKVQYNYIKENLNLMGYPDVKVTEEDFKSLQFQAFYEKNMYFENTVRKFTKKEIESVKEYYIFNGNLDKCTPSSNIQEFIEEFNLENIKVKEKEVPHSLSKWKDEIYNIIK